MPAAPKTQPPTDNSNERPSFVARVLLAVPRAVTSLRHNRMLAFIVLSGLGVIACSAGSVAFYFLGQGATRDAERTIARAFAALDAGQYADAKQLVTQRWRLAALSSAHQGYPLIIMGLVLAREAEQPGREADRATLYLLAARYLEEAQRRGVPAERQEQVALELARCLFHSGRYAESLPALQAAVELNPTEAPRLCRWLATAYRRDAVPQLRPALAALQRALDNPHLAPDERQATRVEQALVQFQLGDLDGCRASLAELPAESLLTDQALILEARCLITEGDRLIGAASDAAGVPAAADKYRQAVAILEQALAVDRTGIVQGPARYLLGVAHRQLGDVPAAMAAYRRARRTHTGTDEGLAATLDEADLQHAHGSPSEALDLYLALLREVPAPAAYYNPWITRPALQARLRAALHRFQTAHQFAAAVTLGTRLGALLPADELTEMEAETQEAWGVWLTQPGPDGAGLVSAVQQAEGRAHFRAAAEAYQRLATLRFATRHYPQDLWKSGHCFLRGHNFSAAIPLLQRYLDCAPRRQHAPGLLGLGECHLALGHFHQALDVLRDCIDLFPKHPETYRARMLASQACVQLQQFPEAKQFLVDNLHNSELTPQSLPWQHSLFAYGLLLFTAAKAEDAAARTAPAAGDNAAGGPAQGAQLPVIAQQFAEARRYLQEAVARYPDAELARRARYCIAESCRYAARLPETSLLAESAPTRRRQLQEQRRSDLTTAAEAYRQLQDAGLTGSPAPQDLSAVDRRIRRNALFAYASVLCDLEDFEGAIPAYATASQRYQHEPVALEALVQLAHCYRRTRAWDQARETVLLARATLARMAADADFTRTTRHSKEGWSNLLDWFTQL